MYRIVSTQWTIIIEDGFASPTAAANWAEENCGSWSCWENHWMVEYYE